MRNRILVVDYKVGNHQSVLNALERLGYDYILSSDKKDIQEADSLILPGVGAFAEAMKNLKKLSLIDVLNEEVIEKCKPILGICIGMQVFAETSEENGVHKGLGWIKGNVVKMDSSEDYKIPHIGWNNLIVNKKQPLFGRVNESANYYFDHSYKFDCDHSYVAATCWHGGEIVAAVQKDNIYGVQFHPEKSQVNGLRLIKAFLLTLKV